MMNPPTLSPQFIANGLLALVLIGAIVFIFVLYFVVKCRAYIREGFKFMWRDLRGLRKIVLVNDDKRKVTRNADAGAKYYMDNTNEFPEAYIITEDDYYIDEFNEKYWQYRTTGTDPVDFFIRQKFIWVEKEQFKDKNGVLMYDKDGNPAYRPLLDKNGRFVSKLNWLQTAMGKYKQVSSDEIKKIDEYVKMGLVDLQLGQTIKYPMTIGGEEAQGMNPTKAADIINQLADLEGMSFFRKYLPYFLIGGLIILVAIGVSIYFGYDNSHNIKILKTGVDTLQSGFQNLTMTTGGLR
jgi:hypothetical protein